MCIRDRYDIEDLKDEVGLGCNDHMQSKRATGSDYAKRLKKYIDRTNNVQRDDCFEWFDGIKHSLTDKNIEKIISEVYDLKLAASTMESFDSSSKKAQKRISQLTEINVDDVRVWNNYSLNSLRLLPLLAPTSKIIGFFEFIKNLRTVSLLNFFKHSAVLTSIIE